MKVSRIREVAADRRVGRGPLPFLLGGQAGARPAREGVRLEVAHVRHWLARVDGAHPRKRVGHPVALALFPVQGRAPALSLAELPPVGQPELRPFIAAVVDESQVRAAGHWPVGEGERPQEAPVPGPLVVE